jgi:hypothetical protein
VPVTEEAEYRMMLRWNAYKAGWLEALEQPAQEPVTLIKHENGNYSPKHQWQGLTDDEIAYVVNDTKNLFKLEDFARAIEQALKEKNE